MARRSHSQQTHSDILALHDEVRRRFRSVEVALLELRAANYASASAQLGDELAHDRIRNRFHWLFLAIHHLKDLAERLAKLKGLPRNSVDDWVKKSASLSLCADTANSYKHGAQARHRGAASLEFVVGFYVQSGDRPSIEDRPVGYTMLVVDNKGELHQADIVADDAVRDWQRIFSDKLGVHTALEHLPEKGPYLYTAQIPPGLVEEAKRIASGRKV